jgi:hypothetical protein
VINGFDSIFCLDSFWALMSQELFFFKEAVVKRYQLKPSMIGSSLVLLMLALSACTAHTASSDNKFSSDTPTVAFCDLVRDPNRHDGQVVRTEAIVAVGFEVAILYDPKCGDSEKRAWYDFDQSSYQPDEKGWKSLRELLFPASKERARHYSGRAKATMVGRFDASDKNGYGHLNQYHFQFTIMRVERAEAVPSDVPD